MLQTYPKSAIRYMWFTSIVGLLLILCLSFYVPSNQWHLHSILYFSLLICIAELVPVALYGKSTNFSVSFPISFAAAMVVGPSQSAISLILGFISANLILRRDQLKDLYLFFFFNIANLGISLIFCGTAFNLVLLGFRSSIFWQVPVVTTIGFFPVFAGALTYFIVNAAICVQGGALVENKDIHVILISNLKMMWPSYVVLTPFAVLIAFLYAKVGMWTVLPFFIPFMAARQCVSLYSRQIQAYTDCVTMLVSMTQRYHPYTREHLEAVAMWSERLAYQLHLPTRKIMAIRMAGELHDIGKIGVGEVILDKQERLSDEDWQVIRSHPTDGARILEKMKYFDEMVPWIRSHHERLDGKGYPDGLTGDEIPYEARIISVADSFHAMISKERRYRTPMTLDEVKTELQRGAGTQWDPDVVAAMLTLLEAH